MHETASDNGVILGAGVPFKIRLHRMVALVSGGTGILDYSHFYNLGGDGGSSAYAGPLLAVGGSDLLNYSHTDQAGAGLDSFTLNVPLGLLIQPHERVALTLRAGYSLAYSRSSSSETGTSSTTTHYVPVGLDLKVTVLKQLDLGASFRLLGRVGGSTSTQFGTSSATGIYYADARVITVGAQGHF